VTDGNVRANRKQKELRDDPRRDSLIERSSSTEKRRRACSQHNTGASSGAR